MTLPIRLTSVTSKQLKSVGTTTAHTVSFNTSGKNGAEHQADFWRGCSESTDYDGGNSPSDLLSWIKTYDAVETHDPTSFAPAPHVAPIPIPGNDTGLLNVLPIHITVSKPTVPNRIITTRYSNWISSSTRITSANLASSKSQPFKPSRCSSTSLRARLATAMSCWLQHNFGPVFFRNTGIEHTCSIVLNFG